MAGVFIDATGAVQGTNSTVITFNYSGITVGSPTNSALLLFLIHSASFNPTGITCAWDSAGTNQAMTLIGTGNVSGTRQRLYGLFNPTPGSKNLAVNWTTTDSVGMWAISLGGVLQTSLATAFLNFTTGTYTTTNNPSLSITTSTPGSDLVIAQATSNQSFTSGFGTTALQNAQLWTGGYFANANADVGSGSSYSANWVISGAPTTGAMIGVEAQWDGTTGAAADVIIGHIANEF